MVKAYDGKSAQNDEGRAVQPSPDGSTVRLSIRSLHAHCPQRPENVGLNPWFGGAPRAQAPSGWRSFVAPFRRFRLGMGSHG